MAKVGLKLIMAVSADGYVCSGPHDDMKWTGRDDKAVFSLLTMVGGILGVGRTTRQTMPIMLPGRSLVTLSTRPEFGMELGAFAFKFPGQWLIGGQTIAMEALSIGLVDDVFLVRNKVKLGGGVENQMAPLLSGRFEYCLAQTYGSVIVETWRRGY